MKNTFVLAAALLSVAAGSQALQNAVAPLERGIAYYWNGEYEATVSALGRACSDELEIGERLDCHSYVAFSHVALGESQQAELRFEELLRLDPGYRLDPTLVSPKILERFDAAGERLARLLFESGKTAYFAGDLETALARVNESLVLQPEDELALEYRQLAQERMALEARRAEIAEREVVMEAEPQSESEPAPETFDENRVYRLTSDIRRPVLVDRVSPSYPRADLFRGVEGSVVLSIVIDREGFVREAKVIRSVSKTMDAAAVEAVQSWRYSPASMDGRNVSVYSIVNITFELDQG